MRSLSHVTAISGGIDDSGLITCSSTTSPAIAFASFSPTRTAHFAGSLASTATSTRATCRESLSAACSRRCCCAGHGFQFESNRPAGSGASFRKAARKP